MAKNVMNKLITESFGRNAKDDELPPVPKDATELTLPLAKNQMRVIKAIAKAGGYSDSEVLRIALTRIDLNQALVEMASEYGGNEE